MVVIFYPKGEVILLPEVRELYAGAILTVIARWL